MKFFKKIVKSPNFLPIVIVLLFSLLAGRYLLLSGYFNMHDDLQMMRQLELEKCFLDGQIPCRWVPDMGYGFGFPLFNFYPPFPYLVGQIFRFIGFSFVSTVKITFLLSFIVSGITMYFLAKEFFGRWGGVISSIFYIWAPYRSVDVYVRGAMNEAWAFCWFPLILLVGYKLIKEKKNLFKYVISLSISWFLLFTTHNLMVLIFTPVFAIWCLLFLIREKAFDKIKDFLVSGLFALGLAAFFTIPAVLEQKYVQVNTLVVGYFEYIAHFATLKQLLISRFWGYGPSVWLEGDGMPFQIGHIHWILSIILLIFVIFNLRKGKKKKVKISEVALIILLFFLVGWISTFMAHLRSSFIWKAIPPLKFVQFPWRFLTLGTLSFSLIAGSLTLFLKGKIQKFILPLLVVLLVFLNWNYFAPEKMKMGPLTDQEKFTGAAWELQQTAGIYDYLPKDVIQAPQEPQKNLAEIIEGEGSVYEFKTGTNWASFQTEIESESSVIRIGIFDFPNWKVFIDGKETKTYISEDEMWGRMYVDVQNGKHDIYLKLFSTPVRIISNYISLVSWLFLLYLLLFKKTKWKK
ncbi:hypothetical protein KJ570_03390 [Patescibacteria group bacterium]|nr:hypothetical protein [Patescibacteria group bacterium]